jgi:hypothetical protein
MTIAPASRRDFLKSSAALIVYFTIAGPVRGAEEQTPEKSVSPDEVQGFRCFTRRARSQSLPVK